MLKSVALSGALALSLAACATPPSAPNQATTATAKPACVPETASRIPAKDSAFCAGFGSTHTKQDVDNTGQQDLSRALPMLDPSVTRTGSH
jgi:hypothetical protein